MKRKVVSAAVFFACLFYLVTTITLLEYFLESYKEDVSNEARQDFSEEFLLVRAKIESSLYSDVFIANGMVTVLSVNKGLALDNFEAFAKALIQNGRYIRNIGVSEGYIISKVYPFKGNEKAIGFDFRSKPEQLETVDNARLSKSVVLAGPLELVQGGQAIIARFPVYNDFPMNTNYWGGVSIVINVEALFEEAGLNNLVEKHDVAIRGLDGTGAEGAIFLGEQAVFEDADITSVIEIPGGSWLIAAKSELMQPRAIANSILIYRMMGYSIIILVLITILLLYRSYHMAHRASIIDELTGLRNRRYAFNLLEKLTQLKKPSPFAIVSVDLNGFKSINDTFGHQAGDSVLVQVADVISNNIRLTDVCCRLGGDEFLIILPRVRQKTEVESVIRKLKEAVDAARFKFEQDNLRVSLSAGYSIYPSDADRLDDLLHKSDSMMYKDKKGKN
ncbi:MAG: sensor domain-containing diguanylate cyclase [Kangiella sp.]|nr:sensor domain-containing diguanylate cyclase [Kangiella sp.]